MMQHIKQGYTLLYFVLITLFFSLCISINTPSKKELSYKEDEENFYNDHQVWDNLMKTHLLRSLFKKEIQSSEEPLYENAFQQNTETTNSNVCPLVRYLQSDVDLSYAHYRISDDEYSINENKILTFLDDPLCDTIVFSTGLFVCGDAMIQNSLTVTSSVNETQLLLLKMKKKKKVLTQAYLDRCLINPELFFPNSSKSFNWCYKEFHVKSAQVYVVSRAEFSSNLIAESITVESGAHLYVGLRNIIYSNIRLVGQSSLIPPKYGIDYLNILTHNTFSAQRERLSRFVKSSNLDPYTVKFKKKKKNIEKVHPTGEKMFHNFSFKTSPRQTTSNSFKIQALDEEFYMTKNELQNILCPAIDVVTGSLEDEEADDTDNKTHMNTSHNETSAQADKYTTGSTEARSLHSSHLLREFSGGYNHWTLKNPLVQKAKNQFQGYGLNTMTVEDTPSSIHPLPEGVTLGDLRSVRGLIRIETGAFAWVYGNIKGKNGIRVSDGASLHSHCGQLLTNVKNSSGLVLLQGATVSAGGYLESVVSRVLFQHGSHLRITGSLLAPHYIQGVAGSVFHIWGELLTYLFSLKDSCEAIVKGSFETENLLDISEGSQMQIYGRMGVGFVQVVDGSSLVVHYTGLSNATKFSSSDTSSFSKSDHSFESNNVKREVSVIDDTLLVDCKSSVYIKGISLLVYNSVFVTNMSQLIFGNGDLYLENSGIIYIAGSELFINGHSVAPRGSLLVGFGSTVHITGNLYTYGQTILDQNETIRNLNTNKNSSRSRNSTSKWFHEYQDITHSTLRPAIFIEESEVTVQGTVEVLNSWVELTRQATLKLGGYGLLTMEPNKSFVLLKQGSTLFATSGDVFTGQALILESKSSLQTHDSASVISLGDIALSDTSSLLTSSVRTFQSFHLSFNSKALVKQRIFVDGTSFSIMSKSYVVCQELRLKTGDLYVANNAKFYLKNGPLWVYGSIIVQASSELHVTNGSVTAVQGDVISENFSVLRVDGPLLLYSAYYTQKLIQDLKQQTILKQTMNNSLIDTQTITDTAKNSHENLPESTEFDKSIDKYIACIRRTPDSSIFALRIIPKTRTVELAKQGTRITQLNFRIHIQVFKQIITIPGENTSTLHLHNQTNNDVILSTSNEREQRTDLRAKEAFIENLQRPTSWETLNYYKSIS